VTIIMKSKVLFITEKWIDGNPSMPLTNNHHNMFSSLANTDLCSEINVIHFDEIFHTQNSHVDDFSQELIKEASPDIIVVCHLGDSFMNPTNKTYSYAKSNGSKIVFMWPDTRTWVYPQINNLYEVSDLNVSWGCERDDSDILNDKHVWMWVPQDKSLYHDAAKAIDVSFIGSLNGYGLIRRKYINYLLENDVAVNLGGGHHENPLSQEDYARFIRTSKMNINFSRCADLSTPDQCKGRVYEAIASNSLLLESLNEATARRFVPGEHYIEFSTMENLKDRIEYFKVNENERIDIAKNGYEHYLNNYTAEIFWKTIFERIS